MYLDLIFLARFRVQTCCGKDVVEKNDLLKGGYRDFSIEICNL